MQATVLNRSSVITGELGDCDSSEEEITDLKLMPKEIQTHLAEIVDLRKALRYVRVLQGMNHK
jgi:hypothetical protein